MHMRKESDLVRGMQLERLIQAIDENVKVERARVRAALKAKSEPTVKKTEPEILNLEACYVEALNAVAPEKDLKGLSPLEYCQMSIYYDS